MIKGNDIDNFECLDISMLDEDKSPNSVSIVMCKIVDLIPLCLYPFIHSFGLRLNRY